jgi:hypothetical protein
MSGDSSGAKPNANLEIFDPSFRDFARRILSVPHSEIKAKLDAEREAKRTFKTSVSRASGALSKILASQK